MIPCDFIGVVKSQQPVSLKGKEYEVTLWSFVIVVGWFESQGSDTTLAMHFITR